MTDNEYGFYSLPWQEKAINAPGLYYASISDEAVYIGMAANLLDRILDHERSPWFRLLRDRGIAILWHVLAFDPMYSEAPLKHELARMEAYWIRRINLVANRKSTPALDGAALYDIDWEKRKPKISRKQRVQQTLATK